jgi:hypothetical protein
LGKKGDMLISGAFQYEKDRDGNEAIFTLNQFEIGVTDRAELLIEPFFQEWYKAKGEKTFHSGMGDLEITPSYMVMVDDEQSWLPAAVLAFKLKVPTATNPDIGTGKYDYLPYIILGKKLGEDWILNMNFGYNFITSPSRNEKLKNQFNFDFSVERKVTDRWSLFAEIFTNSSPASGERGTLSGAIATEYKFTNHINAFISVGYDTDHLFNFRPGLNFEF